MKLPVHNVPTRTEWKKMRDNKGGKSGLSKVEVGPGLDDFHTAYKNAEKSGKADTLNKEITSLIKKMKTYIADVKDKYKDVATVAKTKILDELQSLEAAIEKAGNEKAAGPEVIAGMLVNLQGKNKLKLDPIINSIKKAEADLRDLHKLSSSKSLDQKLIPKILTQVDKLTKEVFEKEKLLKQSWADMNKDALTWCSAYAEKLGESKSQASEKWLNTKTYLELKKGNEECVDYIKWVRNNATKIAGGATELVLNDKEKEEEEKKKNK